MTQLMARRRGGRIVVGVDGSPASKDALRWAVAEAEAKGASLEAVMTWEMPMASYAYGVPVPSECNLGPESELALLEVIQEVVGEHPAIEVSAVVTEGRPATALLAAAKGADLLVVGSRGHGTVMGVLLGSVSEYCVTHAKCPVVVVRHGRKAA
jgi:nucleotide-binding universal stress UspA family protein